MDPWNPLKGIIPLGEVPQYYMHLTQDQADWMTNRSRILELLAPRVRYKKSGEEYTLYDYDVIWKLVKKKL